MSTPVAKKTSKLVEDACALFGVTADKIPNVLWALGLRETCSRCGGSGHHSYNQITGSVCFGCNGRGEKAAKLTRAIFAQAAEKVAAGELEAARKLAREKAEAKKTIRPLVARAKAIYAVIGNAYSEASNASRSREQTYALVDSPLFRAQTMNNAIMYGSTTQASRTFEAGRKSVSDIEFAVTTSTSLRRTDYFACKADLEDAIAMLESLRDAWLTFEKGGAS